VSFAVFVYIAFIIVFIVLRVRKQKKTGARKPWTPAARAAGSPSRGLSGGRQNFEAGRMGEGGKDETETRGGRLSSAGAAGPAREANPVFEFLREISDEKLPAAAAGPEDEDGVVEAAWQAFRPGERRETPPEAPRIEAPRFPQPAAVRPAPFVPAAPETAPKEAARKEETAARPAIPDGFSSRLSRLGPLQRAIVMAEVLGKPKALRGEDI
jgi:hypothetical protein